MQTHQNSESKYKVPIVNHPIKSSLIPKKIFNQEQILAEFISSPDTELNLSSYRVYDTSQVICKNILRGESYTLAVLPDDRLATTSGIEKGIRIWDLKSYTCQKILKTDYRVQSLISLPDGRLASGDDNHIIKLWDVKSGESTKLGGFLNINGHGDALSIFTMLSDGRLVSGCGESWSTKDNTIKIWDIQKGNCLITLPGDITYVRGNSIKDGSTSYNLYYRIDALTVLPDGRLVRAMNNYISLWDTKTGKCLTSFSHSDVASLAPLPNGQLASGDKDGTIKFWDLKTENCVTTFSAHHDSVTLLKISPEGFLVSGSGDKTIKLWNIKPLFCIATLSGHSDSVNTLAFLPNGQLVSRSNKEIRFWDLSSCIRAPRFKDIQTLLLSMENPPIRYLNLQGVQLVDTDIFKMSAFLSSYSHLTHLDIRNTQITQSGLNELNKNLKQYLPLIKIQHDTKPRYQLDFERCAEVLKINPDDKPTKEELLHISTKAHDLIISQYQFILDQPKALTIGTLENMFTSTCSVKDFKLPYTLFNIAISTRTLTTQKTEQLKLIVLESLTFLSKFTILDSKHASAFDQILKSTLRKKIFIESDLFTLGVLKHNSIKCNVYTDELMQYLLRTVKEIQSNINRVEQRVKVVENNVSRIGEDLSQLKVALIKKVEREVYFGVAKAALCFVGGGVIDLLEGICDLSDFIELGTTIFKVDEESLKNFATLSKDTLLTKLGEKGAKELGMDPEKFIQEWSENTLLLQQLHQPVIAESKVELNVNHALAIASVQVAENKTGLSIERELKSDKAPLSLLFRPNSTHQPVELAVNSRAALSDEMKSKYGLKDSSQPELEKGLMNAAFKNNIDDLRFFLKHVKNINAKDEKMQRSALHWAASKNAELCIQELIKHDADPFVTDKQGRRPSTCTENEEIRSLLASAKHHYTVGCV